MISHDLPSGAKVEIKIATFEQGKALYRAFAAELLRIGLNPEDDLDLNLVKNVLCLLSSSDAFDRALAPCLVQATYNGERIKLPDTFEELKPREDYLDVCAVVAKENLAPFTKSLAIQFQNMLRATIGLRASRTIVKASPEPTS